MEDNEKTKDITAEMRDPKQWWSRYHGYGADCDVIDTAAMLKSYADRIDASTRELVERVREAEAVLHKLGEVAGKLDASGGSEASLVDLCQRCRGKISDTLVEYWKKYARGGRNGGGEKTTQTVAAEMLDLLIHDNDLLDVPQDKIARMRDALAAVLEEPMRKEGAALFTDELLSDFCIGEDMAVKAILAAHPTLQKVHDLLDEFFDEA